GLTYSFSTLTGNSELRSFNGTLFLLKTIIGSGNNAVQLDYDIHPVVRMGMLLASANLTGVHYNSHPTTANCFKNRIVLGYDTPGDVQAMSVMAGLVFARNQKLTSVIINSSADCGGPEVALRTYSLVYQPDVDTGLPRLSSVTMTGQQGTTEANV